MKNRIKIYFQTLIWKMRDRTSSINSLIYKSLEVGKYVTIEKNVVINGILKKIGDGTYICSNTFIYNCEKIGKYCSIARDVAIGVGNHPTNWLLTTPLFYSKSRGIVSENLYIDTNSKKAVIIGNDVWIGTKAIILSGVKIGDGAIIAAGAVVTKDIEPYSIVGGVPAKIISYRFEKDIINKLKKINVSSLSIEYIQSKLNNIDNPLEFIDCYNRNI